MNPEITNRYIFVGGAQRTGTTMLQTLLCQHPKTNEMLGEASYLRGLIQAYQLGVMSFPQETEDYFESSSTFLRFHSDIIQRFLDLQFEQRPGMEHLVLKEPHLTKHFPQLHELVPQARFLLIMRDPRDAVSSMVKVGEKMRRRGEQHFFQRRDMNQLCEYFKSFYLPATTSKSTRLRQNICLIRYEDLVTNNPQTFEAIHNFSGINLLDLPKDKDLDMGKFNSLQQSNRYQPWTTKKLGKPPTGSSIGAHKKTLTATEIKAIERNCKEIMQEFSYL